MRYIPLLVDPPIFLLIVFAGLLRSRPTRPGWLVAATAYAVLDGAATMAAPNPFHWQWNWLGKAASIMLAALTMRAGQLTAAQAGIAAPRRGTGRRAIASGLALIAVSAAGNYAGRDGRAPGLETLAFQATMPGLSEELAFRGVLIALFARAYDDARAGLILAGIASTLAFGFAHGLSFDGSLHLAWLPFAFAVVLGAGLMLMRGVTGSILPTIVTHNAANVAGAIVAALP